MRRRCRTAVPAVAFLPVSGNGGNISRSGIYPANAVVDDIGDVQVVRPIHGHSPRQVELRCCRQSAVPAEAVCSRSRESGYHTRRIHFADAVVAPIGDIDIARPVHGSEGRGAKLRRCRQSAVPAEAACSRSRESGYHTRRIHLADAVVAPIGDIDILRSVHRHACGEVELRLNRGAAVPAIALRPRSRDRLDCPAGCGLCPSRRRGQRGAGDKAQYTEPGTACLHHAPAPAVAVRDKFLHRGLSFPQRCIERPHESPIYPILSRSSSVSDHRSRIAASLDDDPLHAVSPAAASERSDMTFC